MTLRSIFAGALLCVLTIHAADARPRHHYRAETRNSAGCSDPVMRPCAQKVRQIRFERKYAIQARHIAARAPNRKGHRRTLPASASRRLPMPPGLSRVMTEGAGRVVNWAKPRAWCGWFMRRELGVANPAGNLARWWAGFGRPAHGPAVGAIVVWRHHVGRITGRTTDGRWIVKSGNDGHRVRERPRSVADAIAFRWPA